MSPAFRSCSWRRLVLQGLIQADISRKQFSQPQLGCFAFCMNKSKMSGLSRLYSSSTSGAHHHTCWILRIRETRILGVKGLCFPSGLGAGTIQVPLWTKFQIWPELLNSFVVLIFQTTFWPYYISPLEMQLLKVDPALWAENSCLGAPSSG